MQRPVLPFCLMIFFFSHSLSAQDVAVEVVAPIDYSDIDTWLCHPENEIDVCDQELTVTVVNANGSLESETLLAMDNSAIDCFYVYPTTSLDTETFADMNPGRHEEIITTFTQFAPFKSQCRLFAPIYRQISIQGLMSAAGNLAGVDQRNYQDVLNAFKHYLEHYNNGRGYVLIGHSQGTSLLTALIANEIDGKAPQSNLVSAILAGNPVVVPKGEVVGGSFQNIPLCRESGQVGCAINFMTYRDTLPPMGFALFGRAPNEHSEVGCTNPASLSGGPAPFDAYLSNIGEVVQLVTPMPPWTSTNPNITSRFVKVPGLLSGECVNDGTYSYLSMTVNADPNDPRTDDIRGDIVQNGEVAAGWGLHLIDMTVVMGDLVNEVGRQAQTWLNR